MSDTTLVAPHGVPVRLPAGDVGPAAAWSRSILRGLAGGLALGVAYRAWMRLVTTEPEFSWAGTLFIVGLVTAVAVGASLCATARRRWERRGARAAARAGSGLLFLLLAAGPGMIAAPMWLFGGLAWGRTSWPTWSRRVLGGLAGAGFVAMVAAGWTDLVELGLLRASVGLATFVLLQAVIARLFAVPTGDRAA